jgi:hypothetical protein
MSIWGEMDINDVPDDPFHIPENTYKCIVTDSYVKDKDGTEALIIKWAIDEPANDYHEKPLTEFFPLFKKSFDELTGKEKQRTSFMKKRLREAFDLSDTQLQEFTPGQAVGKYAYLTVVNNTDKDDDTKRYNNVTSALSERLYQEQVGSRASQAEEVLDF